MINRDDPYHQQQRMLVNRRFTPRAIKEHEDHARRIVTELIDAVIADGECEAIDALASPLPAMMIGDMLGYPRELWPKVREWSEKTMFQAGQTPANGVYDDQAAQMSDTIVDYGMTTMPIIAERRANPTGDLMSVWAEQGWTDEEILSECILLLDGGAETTRTVIGAIIRELSLQPDQRQILIDRPEVLAESGVEEFIRWVSPIVNMRRTVREDHELHGQQLHTGDEMLLLYGAANRDERAFTDPERFDVTRSHNRHVAFGFGTHFCLGASLARLEIRVMFEELLRRIPDWELVDPDEPRILPATFTRAYDTIRIRFTPAS
jgi:cytochrome P450 family 142 subfamily A polypeptide 1